MPWFSSTNITLTNSTQVAVVEDGALAAGVSPSDALLLPSGELLEIATVATVGGKVNFNLVATYTGTTYTGPASVLPISGDFQAAAQTLNALRAKLETHTAVWLSGAVAPTTEGADGDFYIDTAASKVYEKAAGSWSLVASLVGQPGYSDNRLVDLGSVAGSTVDLDFTDQATIFKVSLTQASNTVTFSNPAGMTSQATQAMLVVTQGSGANKIDTWPANVSWSNGQAPVLSFNAGETDVIGFLTTDQGTTWLGFFTSGRHA